MKTKLPRPWAYFAGGLTGPILGAILLRWMSLPTATFVAFTLVFTLAAIANGVSRVRAFGAAVAGAAVAAGCALLFPWR